MGKKNANLSGLARFAAGTFSTPNFDRQTTRETRSGQDSTSIVSLEATEAATSSQRKASEANDDIAGSDTRPLKKRKVGLLGPGLEKYDATGLVPFYQHASQVPEHLQKYFSQRERYFSLYSSGCLLDEEGWYSVTPERIAERISERCRCDVVLDAFCGVGGNAIAFAKTCERVIALDISPVRLALARHNAALYGVADRIEFVLADFVSFAQTLVRLQKPHSGEQDSETADSKRHHLERKIDVVFLSPPWGGPSYLTDGPAGQMVDDGGNTSGGTTNGGQASLEFGLAAIKPIHGKELFELARHITRNVAYFLPRNVRLEEVSMLAAEDASENSNGHSDFVDTQRQVSKSEGENRDPDKVMEMVEVEEEWMGSKLKALTCYFGGLVAGQEDQFCN